MIKEFNHKSKYSITTVLVAFVGVLVSGSLTWFMYFLIQSGQQSLDESGRSYMLDFVRIKREEVLQRKERKPERLPQNEAPPAPDMPNLDNTLDNVGAIPVADLSGDAGMGIDMDAFSIGAGDGEFLPIVKVAPVYPFKALNNWIEGSCSVMYTVTTNGSTTNVRVIEERCENKAFRRPSVEAAKRFKYKPKILNGEAIEVRNVVNTFLFEIKNKERNDS